MNTILVQMAEPKWTQEALYLACAMARSCGSRIILLRLMPTQHFSWLGTPLGCASFSPEENDRIWTYKAIAGEYSVDFAVQSMQCMADVGALVDAADQLDTEIVFGYVPNSTIPLWRKYLVWDLRHQLARNNRTLYTVEQPVQPMILTTHSGMLRH